MARDFRESARKILQKTINQTPEEWHAFYRESYPDITPQETAALYPLFIKSLTATSKTELHKTFREYRRLLAPIKKRNPQPRESEQELFKWM